MSGSTSPVHHAQWLSKSKLSGFSILRRVHRFKPVVDPTRELVKHQPTELRAEPTDQQNPWAAKRWRWASEAAQRCRSHLPNNSGPRSNKAGHNSPKIFQNDSKSTQDCGGKTAILMATWRVQVHINLGKRWNYSSFARLVSSFCWRATKTESATTGPSPQYLWEACKVCTSIVYPYVSPLLYVCHNFAWFLVSKIPVLVGYSKSLLYSIFPIYNSA